MAEVTRWLNESGEHPHGEVFEELYVELKKIANARMRAERQGHTLNPTALVHEAWLRLEQSAPEKWRDRKQFYGAAAEAMRRILVEAARRRMSAKRGGGEKPVAMDGIEIAAQIADERLLAIHEVLDQLERAHELDAQIVKLKFFGGMKEDEIAALLEVSPKTVQRHWIMAKTWLYRALKKAF